MPLMAPRVAEREGRGRERLGASVREHRRAGMENTRGGARVDKRRAGLEQIACELNSESLVGQRMVGDWSEPITSEGPRLCLWVCEIRVGREPDRM
jgi:hypothetical protein